MNALGDYQTPRALAQHVLAACRARGFAPARILEPTCGSGAFLHAAAQAYPRAKALLGIEYQRDRYASDLEALRAAEPRLHIRYENIYTTDLANLAWPVSGPLLVVGNPPWVTAAALGRVAASSDPIVAEATNPASGTRARRYSRPDRIERAGGVVLQPPRANPKHLRGLAARTGAANFDVAEFMLVKLLRELYHEPVAVAMLVKESVARNALAAAADEALGIAQAEIVRIDARAWFGVSVDACCLLLVTSPEPSMPARVDVRTDFTGPIVAGFSPLRSTHRPAATVVFRQGIKHDAADVFELLRDADGVWRNGFAEAVDVESEYVYPLRKAGALHAGRVEPTALIVPQSRLGESTAGLELRAPRLWRYLQRHAARISARKSSIYRSAPPFAFFGIGPYSFAPWKVAVAGMYPQARFRLIGPHDGRPVMLGDTAYFVAFAHEAEARAFADRCAGPAVTAQLVARVVRGKRPITKALLDGIDWTAPARDEAGNPDRVLAVGREAMPP